MLIPKVVGMVAMAAMVVVAVLVVVTNDGRDS